MKKWYAKELATLAKVSVRTLHYYDKIGLLTPSLRQHNHYRLYSEKDLEKLQQIVALKFFGFELADIKSMLTNQTDAARHLALQEKILKKKADAIREASRILKRINEECSEKSPLRWERIIESIEVYQMTKQLDDNWVKEIFSQEELKQYAEFETKLKANATAEDKARFEEKWFELIDEIKKGLQYDPTSPEGIMLGEKFMTWVNNLYGKQYAHLRTKKFEQGFGEGKGLKAHGLTKEIVDWLEIATNAYWKKRIYDLLDKVNQAADNVLVQEWQNLMDDMYGHEQERKTQVLNDVMVDNQISQVAKDWLAKHIQH